MTTTLARALAQSPIHAAWTETSHGIVEVRALLPDRRPDRRQGRTSQTGSARYELLTSGKPQVVGSLHDLTLWVTHLGSAVDWQPIYERAPLTLPRTAQPQQPRGW